MFEEVIKWVVTEVWGTNLGDVWDQAVETLLEPGLGVACAIKEEGEQAAKGMDNLLPLASGWDAFWCVARGLTHYEDNI